MRRPASVRSFKTISQIYFDNKKYLSLIRGSFILEFAPISLD
jgi:hypothetical protein